MIGPAAPVAVRPSGLDVTVYPVTALPPLDAGAVNATDASVSPAVAVIPVGAPGTMALTVNVWLICGAARKPVSPAWSALTVHLPAARNVSEPPEVTVQTPVVEEVKLTCSPESLVAVSDGMVPKFCAPGLLKVMVCSAFGMTLFDAADAGLVPAALVAVTVKVYAVPLVSPVTTRGEDAPLATTAPGLDVTVYPVMVAPPFVAGALKLISTCPSPAVAVPITGAPGASGMATVCAEPPVKASNGPLPAPSVMSVPLRRSTRSVPLPVMPLTTRLNAAPLPDTLAMVASAVPVDVNEKSSTERPVTDSVKVTVKDTEVSAPDAPPAGAIASMAGSVLSTVALLVSARVVRLPALSVALKLTFRPLALMPPATRVYVADHVPPLFVATTAAPPPKPLKSAVTLLIVSLLLSPPAVLFQVAVTVSPIL
uniref:hypothetical protein n=1 Tax=Luteimonas sp. 4-12 TaxID=2027406 RepID=UPI001E4AD2FB|nr:MULTISPECIES: hypothetical protein [Luteimonas]